MILKRKRVLAAKIETTPGTAVSLTAADAAMNIFDAEIQPQIEFVERQGQGSFSQLPGTLGPEGGVATFATELVGGATVPKWASTLLPACGFVDASNVFSPKSEAPGSNVKTLTIALYQDGIVKKLRGCAGNVVFKFLAGKVVRVEFTFTGIWVAPTDTAILSGITYPTTSPLRLVSSALTVGAWSPKIAELTLDIGSQVVMREDAADASGYAHGLITGRKVSGSMNPESTLAATNNIFGDMTSRNEKALSAVLGSTGNKCTFAAPKLQWTNPQTADRGDLQTDQAAFQLNRSASAGDDELTITFA